MRRVLITGSSGEIGGRLAQVLADDPAIEYVAGVDCRLPRPSARRWNAILADIRTPLADTMREQRIDILVHAAFIVQPIHDAREQCAIDVDGTRSVLESAAAAGVQQVVFLSSATVYGAHAEHRELLREEAPLRPNGGFRYAEHKAAAEQIVDHYRCAGTFRTVTVLRPSFVVSPDSVNPLFRHLRRHFAILPRAQSPLQLTHLDDLVEILRQSIHQKLDGTYNVGGEGALSATEMMRRLHKVHLRLSWPVLRPLAAAAWYAHLSWFTDAPPSALVLLRHPWRVSTEKLRTALGPCFRYDSAAAFEDFAEGELRRRFGSQRSR